MAPNNTIGSAPLPFVRTHTQSDSYLCADSRGGVSNGQVGLQLCGELDMGPHGTQQHCRGSSLSLCTAVTP